MRLELLLILALAGCNATEATTEFSRSAAKRAVNPVVAQKFPGLPLEPSTDCVIDNASGGELFTLASAAATGTDDSTIATVTEILRRPGTLKCLANAGLPALLTSL
jgi:hypothetical protein